MCASAIVAVILVLVLGLILVWALCTEDASTGTQAADESTGQLSFDDFLDELAHESDDYLRAVDELYRSQNEKEE